MAAKDAKVHQGRRGTLLPSTAWPPGILPATGVMMSIIQTVVALLSVQNAYSAHADLL